MVAPLCIFIIYHSFCFGKYILLLHFHKHGSHGPEILFRDVDRVSFPKRYKPDSMLSLYILNPVVTVIFVGLV